MDLFKKALPLVAAAGLMTIFGTVQPACAQETTAPVAAKKARSAGGERRSAGGGPVKAALALNDLSAEQKEKLEALQTEYSAKTKELRKAAGAAGSGRKKGDRQGRAKFAALNKETRASVEAILTPEQKKEFVAELRKIGTRGKDNSTSPPRKRR